MLSFQVRIVFVLALCIASSSALKSTSGRASSEPASKAASSPSSDTPSPSSSPPSSSLLSSSSSLPAAGNAATVGIATMLSSLGSITSMVPGMLSSAVPVVLMMGLGALLVPVLGLDSLLRVMKRRSMPSISNNFLPYINTVQDVLQKVTNALEKMEKLYGH